jgi:hypothetical protein
MILYRYLNNPFDTVTRSSYKRMNLMATDHRDKLLRVAVAGTPFAMLYNDYFKAPYEAFTAAYVEVVSLAGRYARRTRQIEQTFLQLSSDKIEQWDIQVQMLFRRGTPEYRQLFPDFRVPFQSGSYDARILMLLVLSENLSDFPNLVALRADVDAFTSHLQQLRSEQQGFEGQLSQARTILEEKRIALAMAMHQVFGYLIFMYAQNTNKVADFYELKYLRSITSNFNSGEEGNNSTISKKIGGNRTIHIWQGILSNDNIILFKNTGSTALIVYTAPAPNSPQPTTALTIAPNEEMELFANELSDTQAAVLTVHNAANKEGAFTATMMM